MLKRVVVVTVIGLMLIGNVFAHAKIAHAQGDQPCAGFESRLRVGMMARVAHDDTNYVREQAGRSFEILGEISSDGVFDVIGGAVCVDDFTWWEVDYDSLIGWTAEGMLGGEYLLEPASRVPTSTPRPAGDLPADLISGVAYTGGAGDFPLVTCALMIFPGEYEPIITAGTSIYATDPFSFEALELPNGQTVESSLLPTFDAAFCSDMFTDSAVVYAPDGETWDADVLELSFEDARITLYQYHLPFEAYAIPGTWALMMNDATVYIEIPRLTEPTHRYLERHWLQRDDDKFRVLLAGYTPNTRIGVITFEGDVLTTTTDMNGNAIIDFPNDTYSMSAIVPESGQNVEIVIYNASFEALESAGISVEGRYKIPQDVSHQILHNAFWGDDVVDLAGWTCPGGLTPRLSEQGDARVISDGLYVRESPSVDADILIEAPFEAVVNVISGVTCGEGGTTWWEVEYNGEWGWSAESRDGVYFMEPIN